MTFLADSNWLVSFLDGRVDARALFAQLTLEGIFLSVVVLGEVYEGLQRANAGSQRSVEFDRLVSRFDILNVDETIARRYASMRADLRSRGIDISDNDAWIAATALAHDLTLVTRDKAFERVPELKLYDGSVDR